MVIISATGYIQVHAYTSFAQLPLENVAITVTTSDGTAIAMRLTDRSGRIAPISVPVPDKSDSQSPDPAERPFTNVDLYAHLRGYEKIEAKGLQLFAGTTTLQDLEMVPLAELPQSWSQTVIFDTPPQNL